MSLMAPPDPMNHERRGRSLPRPRIRVRLRRPWPRPELLEDASLLAGLAAIAAGCGWIFPPAAPIVGGLFLVLLGLRAAGAAEKEQQQEQLREPAQVVEKYVYGDDDEDD